MTRTVNGNIATYVCTSDGSIIDVIPGIYNAAKYVSSLSAIRNRYSELIAEPQLLNEKLIAYHSLHTPIPPAVPESVNNSRSPLEVAGIKTISPREQVALQRALESDSRLNELERRPLIHAYLRDSLMKSNKRIKPDDMKRWLYREVLHADLDDPYLGFDRILTKTYPFDDFGG